MKLKGVLYGAIGGLLIAIGTMAGISASSATATHKAHKSDSGTPHPPGPAGMGAMAIHSVSVVANKAGTGFATITEDSGTVQSVSGQQLTITEGTKSLTYKTVTLTIPAGATIQRDGKSAQLSELQAGDHLTSTEDSEGTTVVMAFDSSFKPSGNPGPGGPGAGGPPPMAPSASASPESTEG